MEGGDISGRQLPRILWVFEGLVAFEPRQRRQHPRWPGRWVKQCQINPVARDRMWWVDISSPYPQDIITFRGQAAAEQIEEWFLDHNPLPASTVHYADPSMWARSIPHLPWVARVLDPDPTRAGAIGTVGLHIEDPYDDFDPLA